METNLAKKPLMLTEAELPKMNDLKTNDDLSYHYHTQTKSFCIGHKNISYQINVTNEVGEFIHPTVKQFVNNAWSSPINLPKIPSGKRFKAVATGLGDSLNLQVILLGADDGQPYLLYQNYRSGLWYWYGKLPQDGYEGGEFDWVTCSNGNNENLQVILLKKSSGNPYLIWQDDCSGQWNWYGHFHKEFPQGSKGYSVAELYPGNDDNLQLVLIQRDTHKPYLIWQDHCSGQWNWGNTLPTGNYEGGFESVQLAWANEKNLQAVFLGEDGLPYLIWQASTNGSWHWYGPLPTGSFNGTFLYYILTIPQDNYINVHLWDSEQDQYIIQSQNGVWEWLGRVE